MRLLHRKDLLRAWGCDVGRVERRLLEDGFRTAMRHTRKGFSLLELMIVIGIVAIVAVLIFPNFTRTQQSGKVETALKILRAKVEHARTLATEIGPQIGPGSTWAYSGCTGVGPAGFPWVQVTTAGVYSIPKIVQNI